ncbi:hypothetical protein ACTXT7_004368 [Hymenolepis weldensis]
MPLLVWGETQMTLIITKTIYLSIAIVYVIVRIVTYFAQRRLGFVRYRMDWKSLCRNAQRTRPQSQRSRDQCPSIESCLECEIYWRRYIETFKKFWLQCFTIWLVCACSLCLFPAVQSLIEPFSKHYFITSK